MRIAAILILLSSALPVLFAQPDRISGAIDSRNLAVLKGSANPQARPEFDRGPLDAKRRLESITLNFKPSAEQQAALDELLKQQQNPASVNYHRWLQPKEYADRFGISVTDLAKVAAWAKSQGFAIEYQAQTRTWVRLSGTVAQAQTAFHVTLRRYEVNGEMHFANSAEPSVPAALEPMISVIRGLDDFYPQPPRRNPLQTPDFTLSNGAHALVPADIWTIYDVNPLISAGYTGAGQKIVVVGQSNTTVTDVNTFRTAVGLTKNPPQIMFIGGTDPGTVASQAGEIDLDLEWASGVAPDASILYVYAEDSFVATQYAIDYNLAPVITASYNTCEQQVATQLAGAASFFESLAQQANALGITWVSSSGDDGAAACDTGSTAVHGLAVNMPASIPEVTGVGGTTLNDTAGGYWSAVNNQTTSGSALKYIPEGAWNDTSAVGHFSSSGGGASSLYVKPVWQTALGVPNDGARDVPDIAFSASPQHDPYVVIEGGQVVYVGGTSVSTPVFAAMLALLNQYVVANHMQAQPGLGNVNPALYRLSHASNSPFHDVTAGNNYVPCAGNSPDCSNGSLGYAAGPGYDEVTGLGSIDVAALVAQFGAPAGAELSLIAEPAIMNQNLSGACPFEQYMTLQETNGFAVDLTSFTGGGENFTSSIPSVFGSLRVPPYGSLSANVCWPQATPPYSTILEIDGADTAGNAITAKTSISFQAGPTNGGILSVSPAGPLQLSASGSQPASGTISLSIPLAQSWSISADSSAGTSSWLSLSPRSGTGAAQITVTGSPAGLAAGAYSAILVFQSQNTTPQYITYGVVFTVGASPSVKITGVVNAASYQAAAAPGMYLSVFGSGLAPAGTNMQSSTNPILYSMAGVSATINGIPAAMEYVSPTQLNVLVPFETPAGPAVLGIDNNGQAASYVFPVSLTAPGIFVDGSGLLAGAENATRGQEIAFYITGQGDVSPLIPSNTAVSPPTTAPKPIDSVSVTIGGAQATVAYAALAYYFEGLTQINVFVPTGIATGQQKVVVTVGGASSPGALLNVTN